MVLLDELHAHRVTGGLTIPVMGLCCLLLVAKRQPRIPAVLSLLQRVSAAGYFLLDELFEQIRRLANE